MTGACPPRPANPNDTCARSSRVKPMASVRYRTTNTGTFAPARTSDVWLPNKSFLRPRRP